MIFEQRRWQSVSYAGGQLLFYRPAVYHRESGEEDLQRAAPQLVAAATGQHVTRPPWSQEVNITSVAGTNFTSFAKARDFGLGRDLSSLWVRRGGSCQLFAVDSSVSLITQTSTETGWPGRWRRPCTPRRGPTVKDGLCLLLASIALLRNELSTYKWESLEFPGKRITHITTVRWGGRDFCVALQPLSSVRSNSLRELKQCGCDAHETSRSFKKGDWRGAR